MILVKLLGGPTASRCVPQELIESVSEAYNASQKHAPATLQGAHGDDRFPECNDQLQWPGRRSSPLAYGEAGMALNPGRHSTSNPPSLELAGPSQPGRCATCPAPADPKREPDGRLCANCYNIEEARNRETGI